MKKIYKNKNPSYCPHLIEGTNDKASLCRLRQLNPVLSPYEVELYCKSKSLNTCPYVQHLSKSASKTRKSHIIDD